MSVEVSIIIPIKDETDQFIGKCLESLEKQKYGGSFEILVVKGGNRAQARNFGIRMAKGEIIAFIDSDCVAPDNWLSSLVSSLKRDKTLGGVGGINFSPPDGTYLSKAIDFVFSSFLGSLGSASLYTPSKPRFVNALACINSAFWRKILEEIGGFDEEFELCEDTNLSYKVRRKGYKLLLDSRIFVWHYRRDTLRGFAKQFFAYGKGRMQSILTGREYASKSIIVPFIGALILPLFAWLLPLLFIASFSVYFTVIFVKGFQGAIMAKRWRFVILIPLLFIIEHLSYFFGLIYGVFRGRWKRKEEKCEVFYHAVVQKAAR